MRIKTISLWQPWASAIPELLKRFETRSWTTPHRGLLAIHAAKKKDAGAMAFLRAQMAVGHFPKPLPFGAVVAIVRLVRMWPTVTIAPELSITERMFGDYSPGRWAWEMDTIRAMPEPFVCPGRQGLFEINIPDQLLPISDAYPPNWKAIATRIKDAAGWKCERCGHAHEVETGHVLTVHHLDGDKANCADWNLAALCQRCHLKIQGRIKMHQMFFPELLPVSAWFKPHLDGYLRSRAR